VGNRIDVAGGKKLKLVSYFTDLVNDLKRTKESK
jgi:hypothetical protein